MNVSKAATKTKSAAKTKKDWLESAAYLEAERFEIAGALFDVLEAEPVKESEVRARLKAYRGERA